MADSRLRLPIPATKGPGGVLGQAGLMRKKPLANGVRKPGQHGFPVNG